MKPFFQQLFDYNFYCNKQLIAVCGSLEVIPERTASLFSHMLNAHHIWNARILGQEAQFGVWEMQAFERWEDLHYENQRTTFEIITNADQLEARISYENIEGRTYANSLKDILFQVINHSTHHRAQIAADLRANGAEPPASDYIFYKRS